MEFLSQFPWWVSVGLSAAAYVGLRFILPLFIPAGPATSANFAMTGVGQQFWGCSRFPGCRATEPFQS